MAILEVTEQMVEPRLEMELCKAATEGMGAAHLMGAIRVATVGMGALHGETIQVVLAFMP